MPSPREDLRSTEESIRRDAEQVKMLEDEKASLDPSDPLVAQLSERIERISIDLQAKAAAERELVDEVQGAG